MELGDMLQAEADAQDAKRYRWVRQRLVVTPAEAVSGSVRDALEIRIGRAFLDSPARPHPKDAEYAASVDAGIDAQLARNGSGQRD